MPSPYGKPNARRVNGWTRDGRRELQAPARKAPAVPVKTWPAPIKRWWRQVWCHPVSAEWDPVADFAAVKRLGDMYAREATSDEPLSAAMLAQTTRLESELLLLPAARKRQYVRLPDPADEHTTTGPTVDYRAMLAEDEEKRRRDDRRRRILRPLDHAEGVDPFDGLRLTADGSVIDVNESEN